MTSSLTDMPVRKSILVHASPEDAFDVFTDDIDSWWPRTHHIGKVPMQRVIIEPKAGGRCYTVQVDGTECDWGRVLAWDPPRRLVLAWQITHAWGYQPDVAQSSEVEVRFAPVRGGSTQVDLEHRFFERRGAGGDAMRTAVDNPNGWTGILNLFVERVKARTATAS
jgi:uncharacterized protein YndB with AHSA1/START domain